MPTAMSTHRTQIKRYRISNEREGVALCDHHGQIMSMCRDHDEAAQCLAEQRRADEQSQVMGAFNRAQLLRELEAEMFQQCLRPRST